MLSTLGGVWGSVNVFILLLIAFKIHSVIGRRCLLPVIGDGSAAEVLPVRSGNGELGQSGFSFQGLDKSERNRNSCV